MPRTIEEATQVWDSLITHCREWWYAPDVEALEIVFATCLSHFALTIDPVWTFIVGTSGSGKTSLAINALSALPSTRIIGDLTEKSLMSGYGAKKKNSLLHRTGRQGIWLFKDFTTFLCKRDEPRKELAAALREIHDGKYTRAGGTGDVPDWEGKITIVAAATPALERAWATLRDLGDRFISVRWRHGDPHEAAEAAGKQIGHEKEIREQLLAQSRRLFETSALPTPPQLSQAFCNKTIRLAQYAAWLRAHVIRDSQGKREIIDKPEIEFPTRLTKAMQTLPLYHAVLRSEPEPSTRLARRIALDSIPARRLAFIDALPDQDRIQKRDLIELTGLPDSTIDWVAEELVAMKVIDNLEENLNRYFKLTEPFAKLKLEALS